MIFDNLKFFVLDEADRLLDDSFMVDVREIVATPGFPEVRRELPRLKTDS